MSKFKRRLWVSFSRIAAGLCINRLFVWSNFNFLHISLWITCRMRLLCDWLFRLYYDITYICDFVASNLFSLGFAWFLWCCFVLQFGEVLILSWSFLFLATSRFSRARCCLLVVQSVQRLIFFPVLFTSYCHSASQRVCSIVFYGCCHSSLLLFFLCIPRVVISVFNADKSSSSLFNTYSLSTPSLRCSSLCMVISFLRCLVHLLKFFSGPLYKSSRISNEEYSPGSHSFDKVFATKFCLE